MTVSKVKIERKEGQSFFAETDNQKIQVIVDKIEGDSVSIKVKVNPNVLVYRNGQRKKYLEKRKIFNVPKTAV